jgi:carboxynorspermidine decarboxylase
MAKSTLQNALTQAPNPCYILNMAKLKSNLEIVAKIRQESGVKILLALKSFAMWHIFPWMKSYLDGVAASSLYELQLGFEYFGKECHFYSPAIQNKDIHQIVSQADHVVFNSISQLNALHGFLNRDQNIALRVNLQENSGTNPLYNPSSTFSRFGVTLSEWDDAVIAKITGLHFHNLCQSQFSSLAQSVQTFEAKFGKFLHQLEWINLGGGHMLCYDDYDVLGLITLLKRLKSTYNLQVYLEPGEGLLEQTGYLSAEVIDIVSNEKKIALLNISATAHMPDVLEMPYRPDILEEDTNGAYSYIVGSNTCLTADIMGEYTFTKPLEIGDVLHFDNMMQYTMVKNNFFNGVELPSIGVLQEDFTFKHIRSFNYEDFKNRLS